MRRETDEAGMTEKQKELAKIGGIPADRPGLHAEYPKMMYRDGNSQRHSYLGEDLPIAGLGLETIVAESAEDEAEAALEGYSIHLDPQLRAKETEKRAEDRAKDERIAELEAQVSRRGRPPKVPENEDLQTA